MGFSEYEAHEAGKAFFKHDRHAMRKLAPLWDPDKPPLENQEYVARAKELEQEMGSELLNLRFGNQDERAAEDKDAES